MKILVTGATGFIGSSLVPELRARGHEVHELRRYHAGGFDFWNPDLVHFADLRDSADLHKVIRAIEPEVIVHLAAESAVSFSFQRPEEVNQVNYMGTIRVAEAAKEVGAWLIQASTSEVYGARAEVPFHEGTAMGGTSPYAASKIAAEHFLAVQQQYGLDVTIMRPFNTIGRALVGNKHFVVERAITGAFEVGAIDLHDWRPQRDFLFRTDHVGLYLLAIENPARAKGETFNACTGEAWTIEEMANYVAEEIRISYGRDVKVSFAAEPDRPVDIPVLMGTNAKAEHLLGWEPAYTVATAIKQAIREWAERLGVVA